MQKYWSHPLANSKNIILVQQTCAGSPTYNGGYNNNNNNNNNNYNNNNNNNYNSNNFPYGQEGGPRVILPGEAGGQPRAGAGGWGQQWPDTRGQGGQWPGPGYDPRCQYRSVQYSTVQYRNVMYY